MAVSDASLKLRAGFGPTSLIAIVVAIFFATSVGFLVAQRQLGAVVPTALAGLALLVIVFGGRYPIGASALIDADSARITKWPWRPAVVNAGDVVGVHVIDRGAFAALMMTGTLSAEGTPIQVVSSGPSILVEARVGRGSLLLPGGASPLERAEQVAKVLGVSEGRDL